MYIPLKKSEGFYLSAQGVDPIPDCKDEFESYHIIITKKNGKIDFTINNLTVFSCQDNVSKYGEILSGGKIGFRQPISRAGEYSNLKVY